MDKQQSCGELQRRSWRATVFTATVIRQELARAGGGAVLNKTWYFIKMLWRTADTLSSVFFIVPTALKEELQKLQKSSHSNSKETGLFFS